MCGLPRRWYVGRGVVDASVRGGAGMEDEEGRGAGGTVGTAPTRGQRHPVDMTAHARDMRSRQTHTHIHTHIHCHLCSNLFCIFSKMIYENTYFLQQIRYKYSGMKSVRNCETIQIW